MPDRSSIERYLKPWVKSRLPWLDPEPVTTETCLYTLTPDHDFIVDKVPERPNAVIGAGTVAPCRALAGFPLHVHAPRAGFDQVSLATASSWVGLWEKCWWNLLLKAPRSTRKWSTCGCSGYSISRLQRTSFSFQSFSSCFRFLLVLFHSLP